MADREHRALIFAHQEWLGFVQPIGLVVAPAVMVDAQVAPDRNISGRQRDLRALLTGNEEAATLSWRAPNLRRIFLDYLGWEDDDLVEVSSHRDTLEIALPELQVVLAPTWAVPDAMPADGGARWMMLIRVEDAGADLDAAPGDADGWNASRNARFERLLRETGVPIGLLCTDRCIRLVYAPKGESSGHVTFDFSQMAQPAGRPILAAFDMLLSATALFNAPERARLPALLKASREAQAEVSTRLARQVLAALYELLRGFVAADARHANPDPGGGALARLARERPNHLYGGLITALMRMVFALYAEDRGLMPDHEVYQRHYALGGLYARLRADAAAYPDTMDQRFGAWAQLLSLFRLIHRGGGHGGLRFVARRGRLFDPDRYPFLEGLPEFDDADGGAAAAGPEAGAATIPMVPDATVWKVLQHLTMLDGERLSYRTLDVEQIGSVYEAIMGFRVEVTAGRAIAVRSKKKTGAAIVVDLDALLALDRAKRAKALQDQTDQKLTGAAATALRNAASPEDMVATLDRKVDRAATPDVVPAGTPVLQPTDERRRSGSHYTPRSLTEPIVAEALRPIFERMGPTPTPTRVLDLKILDPAMGSGAFLVEACRQVAAKLVAAWDAHGGPPPLPADEDPLLHARRLVAQRCLYGVDKNPMAVDLARLSLWLATLARDHEFTFVDHALRHGNFLVGLTMDQIAAANWAGGQTHHMALLLARGRTQEAEAERARIRNAADGAGDEELRPALDRADRHLAMVRLVGDAVVAAFFAADKAKTREAEREKVLEALELGGAGWHAKLEPRVAWLRHEEEPVDPFHFEIEFPEVFDRDNAGFDVIVGNPPFLGGTLISNKLGESLRDWLYQMHPGARNRCDLVAYFFRRAFDLLRLKGTFGLIACNTISQGDTRSGGLAWICAQGGEIYRARKRIKWPGEAAVVVSVVHIAKGHYTLQKSIDNRLVEKITAYLVDRGDSIDPISLASNHRMSFTGTKIYGQGFLFDDSEAKATPLSEMQRLVDEDQHNGEIILPYIGGDEINKHPTQSHYRFVINFDDMDESTARKWPSLFSIVEEKVKPERISKSQEIAEYPWWKFWRSRRDLYDSIRQLPQVIVTNCGATPHLSFAFQPPDRVFAHSLTIFPLHSFAAFCMLQCRVHEIWAWFFGSSLEDRLRYTSGDCFETFPFPVGWEDEPEFEAVGRTYYEYRATHMFEHDEGLTKTYNRFHDREERSKLIGELRHLHDEMDRAVLAAYGWDDIKPECQFELEWEDDDEDTGRRKKPWRYRWPEEIRDEVLARLLALNAERAREERMAGGDVALLKARTREG